MSIRLNKLIARRGVASRRRCDELIADGHVRVNGRVVTELGTMVEEGRDRIEVNGKPLPGRQAHVYYVLNKPVGVITTMDDPEGRRTIRDFLPRVARVYPVGRLDADTSGLLLLTNDGDLAHRLMHPRYGVVKVYRVRLRNAPTPGQLARLARGVEFEPGVRSAPAMARRIDPGFDAIMIEVQIHEGRFRQVRRMCEAVGLDVTGLHRVGYGPIRLGPLARGMFRELSEEEVAALREASSRPGGTARGREGGKAARSLRPGGGAAPSRPLAKRAVPMPPAEAGADDEDDDEATWVPGGGFTAEFDDEDDAAPPAWPARPAGRRGDAGFAGPSAPRADREPARAAKPTRAKTPEWRPAPSGRRDQGEARPRRGGGAPRGRGERADFAPRGGSPVRGRDERRSGPPTRGGGGAPRGLSPRPERRSGSQGQSRRPGGPGRGPARGGNKGGPRPSGRRPR